MSQMEIKVDVATKIINTTKNYMVLRDDASYRKVLYHVLSCHLIDLSDWASRLCMLAPTAKCGKTRIRDITKWLVPNSVSVVDPSPSSILTEITLAKQDKKTVHIAIDEFGQYYNGKRDCSEITAIVDAGVKRGETATRTYFASGRRQVERLETFAPMCWTGSLDKGQSQFPDSMLSRAFVINVPKRNRKTEKIKRYIEKKVKPIFVGLCHELSDQFGAQLDVAQGVVDGIDGDIPEAIEDRVYEKYYLAIAGCKLLDMYGTDGTDGTDGNPPRRAGA
jgi:hypothetical protein